MRENIIQSIVEEHNLSLHKIAEKVGYNVAVISRVKNRVQKMSFKMAYKLSQAFDIPLEEIIEVEKIK